MAKMGKPFLETARVVCCALIKSLLDAAHLRVSSYLEGHDLIDTTGSFFTPLIPSRISNDPLQSLSAFLSAVILDQHLLVTAGSRRG